MSAITDLTTVAAQIQQYWAPMFTKELRDSLLLGSLVNRDYQGEIRQGGDTVKVSQINAPTGELRTIGTDADVFATEELSESQISIKADKRAVASYEFTDLVGLQSQISMENSEVREALLYAVSKQINKHLYSLVAASASAPDHQVSGVSDLAATNLAAIRILAGQAAWPKSKPWYALVDPQYYMDMGDDTTLSSSDYNAGDAVIVSGEIATKRFGFNILEDNYLPADHGLFFYPDFMHMVMQRDVQIKISDLHSQKKFGYVMSVDVVFGAKLSNDGDIRHVQVYNSAWAPNG